MSTMNKLTKVMLRLERIQKQEKKTFSVNLRDKVRKQFEQRRTERERERDKDF